MAACTHQGDYGRQRLWGAVGWGLFAPVAGYLIRHAGVAAAFAAHAALMLVALGPTLRLPFGPLHAKLDEQLGDDLLEPKCSGPSGDLQLDEAAADGTAGAHGAAGGSKVAGRCDSALDAQRLLRHGRAGQPAAAGTLEDSGSGSGGGGSAPPAAQQWMRFWRGLRQLLGNPEAAIFLAQALFFGFGVGNIESFLFLYLDEMGEAWSQFCWGARCPSALLPPGCAALRGPHPPTARSRQPGPKP